MSLAFTAHDATMNNAAMTWLCPACMRENLTMARFCGACGQPRPAPAASELAISFELPQSDLDADPDFASESEPGITPDSVSAPAFGTLPRSFAVLNGDPGKPRRKTLRSHRFGRMVRVFFHHNGWLMVLVFMVVCGLSPILAFQPFGPRRVKIETPNAVVWNDLKSHLSRQLGLTLSEVEKITFAALQDVPEEQETMECGQAQKLRAFIDSLEMRGEQVFRWLPRRGPLLNTFLAEGGTRGFTAVFSDVPTDHPVYKAWKTLLENGILARTSCGDEPIAQPFVPLSWKDWNLVFERILGREAYLEFQGRNPHRPVQGDLSAADLGGEIQMLAEEIHVDASRLLVQPIPEHLDRFAAFALLSRLLSAGEGS
jgi:hypothetical protein